MFNPTARAAAALAGLMIGCVASLAPRAATEASAQPAQAGTDAVVSVATGAVPARPQPATPTWRTRPVFVCRGGVPVIFSDRPCGELAEARELRVLDPGPGRAPSVARVPPKEATRPRVELQVAEARPVSTDDRCRRLREERERLDGRMRAGYSAREAAKLWERWREVDAKIYAARC